LAAAEAGVIRMRTTAITASCVILAVAVSAGASPVMITVAGAATGDNALQLWIDGALKVDFDQSASGLAGLVNNSNSDWRNIKGFSIDVAGGSPHQLAAKVIEAHIGVNINTNAAGFIACLDAGAGNWFAETGTRYLVTNDTWSAGYVRQQTQTGPYGDMRDYIVDALGIMPGDDADGDDWRALSYDEGDVPGWANAYSIGANGVWPWGTVKGACGWAEWIWTEDWLRKSPAPYTDTTTPDSPVFFRTTFTAVPEPVTAFGVVMGLVGIGAYIRKRRRRER